jgi:hypothetical protein
VTKGYMKTPEYKRIFDKGDNREMCNYLAKIDKDREWRTIPGAAKYLASSNGEILTLKTFNYTKGVSAGHYLKVSIYKDKAVDSKMEYVHKLVSLAFNGIPEEDGTYWVVCHGDDNKFNNRADNLTWCSQSDNIKDAWSNGLIVRKLVSGFLEW